MNKCGFIIKLVLMATIILAALFSCGDDDDDNNDDDDATPDDDDDNDDNDDDDNDDNDDNDNNDNDNDDDTTCWDIDNDGYEAAACGGEDCDDEDPLVHPGVYDVCGDNVDNDCDDVIDNPDDEYVTLPEFFFGASSSSQNTIAILQDLGMHWYRVVISWKTVMPEVPDPDLTRDDIEQNPQMINDLIDTIDWTSTDNMIKNLNDAGINVMPLVGHGYGSTHSMYEGERASPYLLGEETYLAYMYLHVRAIVEHYDGDGFKDAEGIVIKYWQIENELNQALLTAIWGWREPQWLEALYSPWASWDFCTELLATLNRAVHDADPDAVTTQNLHTDIHPNLSRLILQPTWSEAATLWRDHMDIIGFDAYPNYYLSEPVYGNVVGERTETLYAAGCGKPVMIMEIGYPTGPEEFGYTWENQALFIDEAFHSSYDAGAVGYFQFGLTSADTHTVEITDEDIANMEAIGPLFTAGRALPLFFWAIANLDYLNDHFLDVVKGVEGYWGVATNEGEQKDGYAVLQGISEELYGSR